MLGYNGSMFSQLYNIKVLILNILFNIINILSYLSNLSYKTATVNMIKLPIIIDVIIIKVLVIKYCNSHQLKF